MVGSVNTNIGAQIALNNLNVTGTELQAAQKQISTGLRAADAFDNGAVFAIAQGLRSDISAISAVNGQLGAAKGLLEVTVAAVTGFSNALSDLRQCVLQLADANVTGNARTQLNSQFETIIATMHDYVTGANYNGANLISSGSSNRAVIQDISANQYTIHSFDLETLISWPTFISLLAGPPPNIAPANQVNALQWVQTPPDSIDYAEKQVGSALNGFAADAHYIDNQITFNNSISDATSQGLGSLVDADLAKQSAQLQSLQIKQQLGTQALSIANQAPQILLGLFR